MRVVPGVSLHSRRERAFGPIGLLRPLFQGHPQILLEQIGQSELAVPEQAACEHGVKNPVWHEPVVLAQEPQIIIGPVQNQPVQFEFRPQRGQRQRGQRVNQPVLPADADLKQAELFRVGMETVRLRVEGDDFRRAQFVQEGGQRAIRVNHR